jgi:hypothetical protein
MKENSNSKEDPSSSTSQSGDKVLESFKLFYEAIPFEVRYKGRSSGRLQRPSRLQA